MTDEQYEEMLDRLDEVEERLRILEIGLDSDEDTAYYVDDLEEDDIDILD